MRRIVAMVGVSAAVAATATGTVLYWRRHPRLGTRFANEIVNPALLRRGMSGLGPIDAQVQDVDRLDTAATVGLAVAI